MLPAGGVLDDAAPAAAAGDAGACVIVVGWAAVLVLVQPTTAVAHWQGHAHSTLGVHQEALDLWQCSRLSSRVFVKCSTCLHQFSTQCTATRHTSL